MPFGKYKDFADCVKKVKKAHPEFTTEQAQAYCASIERKISGKDKK